MSEAVCVNRLTGTIKEAFKYVKGQIFWTPLTRFTAFKRIVEKKVGKDFEVCEPEQHAGCHEADRCLGRSDPTRSCFEICQRIVWKG